MGIVLAVTFLSGISSFTQAADRRRRIRFLPGLGRVAVLVGFAAVAWVLIRIPMGHRGAK